MAKEEVLRKDLELAQWIADKMSRNLKNAPPELVEYWTHEFVTAREEILRLKRELKSRFGASL